MARLYFIIFLSVYLYICSFVGVHRLWACVWGRPNERASVWVACVLLPLSLGSLVFMTSRERNFFLKETGSIGIASRLIRSWCIGYRLGHNEDVNDNATFPRTLTRCKWTVPRVTWFALKYNFSWFASLIVAWGRKWSQPCSHHSSRGGGESGGGGGPQGYTPHPAPTYTHVYTHTKKLQPNRKPG